MSDYRLGADMWLWLDPSQACNIACELCYTRPSQNKSFLSLENAALYLAKLKEAGLTIQEITLNWRGEPLMNKAFPDILQLAIDACPTTRIQFHTNAMLLTDRMCERLCAVKGSYYVYLSIDGGNKSSHERNRGLGTFDKAVRGGLNLLRRRGGRSVPHISLYQLDLRLAESEYDQAFLDLAAKCDVWQRVVPIVRNGSDNPVAEAAASAVGVNPSDLWGSDASGPPPTAACFWAGYSLSVAPSGDVSVCILNQASDRDGILGNLRADSAASIVARAAEFRRSLERRGRSHVAHCASCRKVDGKPRAPRAPRNLNASFALER